MGHPRLSPWGRQEVRLSFGRLLAIALSIIVLGVVERGPDIDDDPVCFASCPIEALDKNIRESAPNQSQTGAPPSSTVSPPRTTQAPHFGVGRDQCGPSEWPATKRPVALRWSSSAQPPISSSSFGILPSPHAKNQMHTTSGLRRFHGFRECRVRFQAKCLEPTRDRLLRLFEHRAKTGRTIPSDRFRTRQLRARGPHNRET